MQPLFYLTHLKNVPDTPFPAREPAPGLLILFTSKISYKATYLLINLLGIMEFPKILIV
jgi:hypothetical protein